MEPPPEASLAPTFERPPDITPASTARPPLPRRRPSTRSIIILILCVAFSIGFGSGLVYVFFVAP